MIAAFDFDGTLTRRDSLMPFLYYILGPLQFLKCLLFSIPSLISYLFGFLNRKELKEVYLTQALKGVPVNQARAWGSTFALQKLDALLRKEALNKIAWHQAQGHEVILISANLDLYLEPWGKAKKLVAVLCSRTAVSAGVMTGKLEGENCRGEEKVKQLSLWAGDRSDYTLWAYGDSEGDKELLAFADHPHYRGIQ